MKTSSVKETELNFDTIYDDTKALYNLDEKTLHQFFHHHVKDDFHTVHEVNGFCHLNLPAFENKEVRADFLLYPRQHLIDAGFVDTWFAVGNITVTKSRKQFSIPIGNNSQVSSHSGMFGVV